MNKNIRENDRLKKIVQSFSKLTVTIVGDLVADEFVFGEISRVSREAPVLILKHRERTVLPGGGANAVYNLADLGVNVLPVGVVGDDEAGKLLIKSFRHKHLCLRDFKEDCTIDTTHRVVCGAHGLRPERSSAMVTPPSVPVPQTARPSPPAPLRILRTETVLSRFPINNLTTHGRVSIHLRRTNAQGDLDYLWDVSTSAHYGPPGPLGAPPGGPYHRSPWRRSGSSAVPVWRARSASPGRRTASSSSWPRRCSPRARAR